MGLLSFALEKNEISCSRRVRLSNLTRCPTRRKHFIFLVLNFSQNLHAVRAFQVVIVLNEGDNTTVLKSAHPSIADFKQLDKDYKYDEFVDKVCRDIVAIS